MVYIIPKDELPQQQYTPVKFKGETVMMTVVGRGVVMMFLDIGENVFADWDEIIEYSATAKRMELPKPPEPEPTKPQEKKGIREVRPSKPN